MKVVLFCGGYGMRMREGASDDVPKPMAMVGPRPLIWHVMRYYAHFGHKEFILCLGYGAHHIKDFFLNYEETTSNDFVLRGGRTELLSTDIADWTITFAQTGIESPIGERLRRVRHHLDGDEMFLANYADVLTDAPLPEMIDSFARRDAGASMMVVPPQSSFHCVDLGEDGLVGGITAVSDLPLWENGGYFVLRRGLRPHTGEWGPGRRRLHPTGQARKAGGAPAPRLLEADRHREGAGRAGRRLHPGRASVGRVGAGRRHGAGRGEDRVIALGAGRPDRVVAVGAHCDDIAIGAGGTLLTLCLARPGVRVDALVLSGGGGEREQEERAALAAFCPGADLRLTVLKLPDGRMPAHWEEAKAAVEELRGRTEPDLVLAPRTDDAHQDHRGLAKLMTTAFRDHLVLRYEIVKWDGDLGRPTAYQPLSQDVAEQKVRLLQEHYPSQRHRPWYDREAFLGLARIRGIECHARYAEAFDVAKLTLNLGVEPPCAYCSPDTRATWAP